VCLGLAATATQTAARLSRFLPCDLNISFTNSTTTEIGMMIEPATASGWGIAALRWLQELPATIKAWRRSSRYPAVSIVPQRDWYHEAKQSDGTIATQVTLDCLITNGSEDCGLLIPRVECHVRGFGTVKGVCTTEQVSPSASSPTRFIFHFSRALNRPRGCAIILFDQFGKKHKKRITLNHGRPHDPI
jgi:hypothetical protein